MCRLLGWAAASPCSGADLLGDHLAGFTDLSVRHADGWGAAFASTDGSRDTPLRTVTEPVAARTSPEFAAAMRVPACAAAVHLRWATPGLTVRAVNTHPFLRGGVAFAHNGELRDVQRAESLTDHALVGEPAGDTDSERYFLAVLTQLQRGATPAEAIASVAAGLAGSPSTSLNAVLLTEEQLVAVCLHDPALLPHDEVADYFHLSAERVTGSDGATQAVVVGSSGALPESGEAVPALGTGAVDGWVTGRREVPNGSVLTVDRTSLSIELLVLDA